MYADACATIVIRAHRGFTVVLLAIGLLTLTMTAAEARPPSCVPSRKKACPAATTTTTSVRPTTAPTTTTTSTSTTAPPVPAWRSYFSASAAMWNPIGASPAVDPKNDSIVSMLAQPNHSALLYAYGNPIYEATSSTPRYSVAAGTLTITNVGADKWGDNDLAHHSVAIPDAMPSAGTDGKFVVIDRAQGLVFDMWQAHRTASGWAVSWGGVYPLNGDGSSHNPSYQNGVPWMQPVSRGTGAGLSTLFGTIRLSEIRESQINHALVFATDMACGPANTGPFRWPATTTDGNGRFSVCIPQGARVQLDPTIDLYAIPGITRGELTVGLTLQRYGAYANDNGGCRMCIVFEVPPGGEKDPANPYPAAGFAWDYYDMNHLPWGSLRVLNAWDGS